MANNNPSPFKYPREANEYWTPVIWYKDETETDGRSGFISQPKTESCDITVYDAAGTRQKHDCLHADDPRVKERPQEHQSYDRGIFRVAPRFLEQLQAIEAMQVIRTVHSNMTEDVYQMARKFETIGNKTDAVFRKSDQALLKLEDLAKRVDDLEKALK